MGDSDNQTRFTRIIWTVFVSVVLGAATYLLYQSIEGFSTKYVSTTIETRFVQEFPFPAVTFCSRDLNFKNAFLRIF